MVPGWLIMIPPILTLYFAARILFNNLRYSEAALGMLFSNINETTFLLRVFAVSMIFFSATRVMDLIDLFHPIPWNDEIIASIIWLVDIVLVYVFYRVAATTAPKEKKI
ncbi:hypothetical protein [Methanothermobacter marburgensis]|uniref:Uncharacterized protein n=1 Tax=Methanothermobacter marburgensis (strain ATCC BAA-927 / DSM 2133 / JCM 14651 / NBRC 100331 / OCM 82 / Marburg) TaxID=79929 RepID=D9PW78_METTM|nr:hypothetical protein [Methanothermobacter marburgensis]ADL58476.1 conserved hypothetical protein [Methanothermobacter marburgensis str. Marburg]